MKICDWKRFTAFLVVVLLIIIVCLHQCSKKELEIESIENYEVQSGETLWSICSKFKPERMSIQEYIYNIQKFNGKDDCIIYPNETLQIIIYGEEA